MQSAHKYLIVFALLGLVAPALAQNPVLDGLWNASVMARQIEQARALQEARATLQHEQARIDAERERLRAETDLLREQLRHLQQEREGLTTAEPAAMEPTVPSAELVRTAFQRVAASYPDAYRYGEKIARLAGMVNAVETKRTDDVGYYHAYIQALYLLARWMDGAEIGDCAPTDKVFTLPEDALDEPGPEPPTTAQASASNNDPTLSDEVVRMLRDPVFRGHPREVQLKVLRDFDTDFARLPPEAQEAAVDDPKFRPIAN